MPHNTANTVFSPTLSWMLSVRPSDSVPTLPASRRPASAPASIGSLTLWLPVGFGYSDDQQDRGERRARSGSFSPWGWVRPSSQGHSSWVSLLTALSLGSARGFFPLTSPMWGWLTATHRYIFLGISLHLPTFDKSPLIQVSLSFPT